MAAKKEVTQHAFDIDLAVQVGIEKAILLGGIQFWISENEKRKSDLHFRQGEYWTYDTAAGFALKYPYLNAKSINRWMQDLEREGWLKKEHFKLKGALDRTTWYGRGERYLKWLNLPISQNEESEEQTPAPISQNEPSISQNENPISQNEPTNSQNEKSLYKDTVNNPIQTTVDKQQSLSSAGETDVLEVETEEVFSETSGQPQSPQTPGCAAPLSPGLTDADRLELAEYTQRLQRDSRVVEGLSRIHKLRGDEASWWIEQFVSTQWTGHNLTGRTHKDLVMHCQSWIGTQLKNQHEREQRQAHNPRSRNGHRQSRTETGADIDRLADELFST